MGDLFDFDKGLLQKDKLQSSKNDDDGKYDFITAADEWKKHSSYSNDCEALVYAVSAGGSLGKSQYVNGKFMCSNLCSVLTEKEESKYEINMKFFNMYLNQLREDIVDSLADGTSKLTLNNDALKEYYIEYVPIEIQNSFVNNYLYNRYEEQEKKLNELENELKDKMEKIINPM